MLFHYFVDTLSLCTLRYNPFFICLFPGRRRSDILQHQLLHAICSDASSDCHIGRKGVCVFLKWFYVLWFLAILLFQILANSYSYIHNTNYLIYIRLSPCVSCLSSLFLGVSHSFYRPVSGWGHWNRNCWVRIWAHS